MTDTFRRKSGKLSAAEQKQVENIKRWAEALEDVLTTHPESRERSLALTKLEECVMWAVKGLTK